MQFEKEQRDAEKPREEEGEEEKPFKDPEVLDKLRERLGEERVGQYL